MSHSTLAKQSQLHSLSLDSLSMYRHCVVHLTVHSKSLQDLFLTLLNLLPNLEAISLTNCKLTTLQGVGQCHKLRELVLPDNNITEIHPDANKLNNTLERIDLSGNPIKELPSFLHECRQLKDLNMARTNLMALPENIGDLCHLLSLDLKDTMINKLPESFRNLRVIIMCILKYKADNKHT